MRKRVSFVVTIAAALLWASAGDSSVADAGGQGHELVHLEGNLNKIRFSAGIVELPSPDGGLPVREFRIRCVDGCRSDIRYHEDFYDYPVSLFRCCDNSDKFISVWTTGSAYVVRLYAFSSGGVQKILEVPTKGAPQFAVDPRGAPVVIVNDPDVDTEAHDYAVHGLVWIWNGQKYELSGGAR